MISSRPTAHRDTHRRPRDVIPAPRAAVALLVITSFVTATDDAHAQLAGRESTWDAPQWMGDVAFAGVNALTSGVGAGLIQMVRGGTFRDGFTRGAMGGIVHYAGMRVTVQRFTGAGLLGRQISAAGVSMTRNAAEGRGTFDQLFIPLGPVNLYLQLGDTVSIRPKVDLTTLTMLVYAASEQRLEFDLGESLSAGAPVFLANGHTLATNGNPVAGLMTHGVIMVGRQPTDAARDGTLAHERVHVAQRDWLFHLWSDPAETWLAERIPAVSSVHHYVDFNIIATGTQSVLYATFGVASRDRLHEIEAHFLEQR